MEKILRTFEIAVEETLNPSSKDMRLLKEKILSLLDQTNICTINNIENNISNSKNMNTKRKPHSIVPDQNRCEALICDLEMNSDKKLVPARCKRSMLQNSKYCKQHGSIDGTINTEDSEHFGKEIKHDFKWGHLGTIHKPSYVFEKSYDILLKKYNAKNNLYNGISNENNIKTPNNKKEKPLKSKRTIANGFITYKSDKFNIIKNSILQTNNNISGRDLVVAITKEASERWKSISDEEKALYKKQAVANKTAISKPVSLLIESDSENEEIVIPQIDELDDETTLVYNPSLKIWVDTDNNLCYETKDNTVQPLGQLQRGKMTIFPKK
jgi:hypothetical protein